jgi:probable DNA metabolism protein
MHSIRLDGPTDFSGWRTAARRLLLSNVPPEQVQWLDSNASAPLFSESEAPVTERAAPFSVPRSFLELASSVALHRDPGRFALLYRLLWRLRSEPELLRLSIDEDVARARAMSKAVEREIHKMHAFVRFRQTRVGEVPCYVAWFEPEHHVLEAAAPFFVRRFANACWSILTPERSAHWDTQTLEFGPGARRADAPADDAHEELWRTYYGSIFNPARLKIASMRQHMPKKYWRNLPESGLIPTLIAGAQRRTEAMLDSTPTEPRRRSANHRVPAPALTSAPTDTLSELKQRVEQCRACPLWQHTTQAVFGEGPISARIVLVGEQPGDEEDISGRPFVGPAGKLLNRALLEAGLDRNALYVTNAVKHFKFEPRGKRRLHKTPGDLEIAACRGWLAQELALLQPDLIVALGATAAKSILGRKVAIGEVRGRILTQHATHLSDRAEVLVTVHPSYLLRVPDERKAEEHRRFVEDLKEATHHLRSRSD